MAFERDAAGELVAAQSHVGWYFMYVKKGQGDVNIIWQVQIG